MTRMRGDRARRGGTAAVGLAALLLGGCVGGGALLPPSETTLGELYREAYGRGEPEPASGPMDVRMRRFCERFASTTRLGALFGSVPVRARRCLETAAAEGLLSGHLEHKDCEGAGCAAVVVEERWPPPLHPGWSGRAVSGLDAVFPRLANPDVLVYVYPHVATPLGVGVPGYVTAMPLFERTEYALPGEAVSAVPPGEWPVWEADDAGREPFVASPRRDPAPRVQASADGGHRDAADVAAGRGGLSSLLARGEGDDAAEAGALSGDVTGLVAETLARGAALADAVSGFVGGAGEDGAADLESADGDETTGEPARGAAGPEPEPR